MSWRHLKQDEVQDDLRRARCDWHPSERVQALMQIVDAQADLIDDLYDRIENLEEKVNNGMEVHG